MIAARSFRRWRLAAWTALLAIGSLLAVGTPLPAAEPLVWNFDHARDVFNPARIEPGEVHDGRFAGWTEYDPFFFLRLPLDPIDAAQYTWLTVRLYSSQKADLLDVYYQSPDKNWCLGGKFPIVQGWATYCLDLNRVAWRETTTGAGARQWGGPAKRVSTLRLDPGNQPGRWIAVDDVRLEPPRPGLVEGVTVEPRGRATFESLHAPATVELGRPLPVTVRLTAAPSAELSAATLFVRLRRGTTLLRCAEHRVALNGQPFEWRTELTTSPYWSPDSYDLEVGSYELDLNGTAAPTASVAFQRGSAQAPRPPVVELRPLGGDPAIFVNGQPLPGFMYLAAGGLHPAYHREAAQAGLHLYSDWFGSSTECDLGHVAADRYDYAQYDRYFAAILDLDPQAWFLPHLGLTGPKWWQQSHADEMCQFADGTRGPTSFASQVWRQDIGQDLRRLIAHLRTAPYADRIIGYIFFNGYTAEWQMWGTWKTARDDYSPPARRAYREFLTRQYGSDARLQAAWNDPQVTLATADMPTWAQRRPDGPQVLRDLRRERPAIDFYRFVSHMDADAVLDMAHIVRQATGGRSLVGTYYGYLTAHGINQVDSGHLAARRVFDSPDIDFVMSPPNYWYRKPGEACTFMSASDSLRRRGKLWLDESDHRTHLTPRAAGYGRAATLEESVGVFWRETAHVLSKRAAVSWFDMSGGWFSQPEFLAEMAGGARIAREALTDRRPFTPEVCVLIDPESFYYTRPTLANSAFDLHQVTIMPQAGAPWDFCLLDDLVAGRLPPYKFYVFLNPFYLDAAQRAAITAALRQSHATALFIYAAGYLGPEGPSLDALQKLTGIRCTVSDQPGPAQLRLQPADRLAQGLPADKPLGSPLVIAPRFAVDDPEARIVATMDDGGRPALAVKPQAGWTSVYSAAMELPPDLIRNIARSAGVHIWLDTPDALYTDGQWLGVHAATAGTKTIHLPRPCKVFDARTGRELSVRDGQVQVEMAQAQTVLLRMTSP